MIGMRRCNTAASHAGHEVGIVTERLIVTMPKTAEAVQRFGMRKPEDLDDGRLEVLKACLDQDLPGSMDFIVHAAENAKTCGGFAYVSKSPEEMLSRLEWNRLVGYLARLFASPFGAIAQEYVLRRYGMNVAFVNCCIVAAWPGDIDEDELWCLQARMQRTPDC